ncbi:hypothetical protein BpHYR1_054083 [Brachionus plicatilis]|uniref:Uncharacterized protein n=1 Tax=Brachionus plicatilis TaxID=10195 RepID=A0A3M7PPD9_BRAPC|nr:hypothetical protein BpHYR1_054083 [Brachionus plicatilis]
MLYFYRNISISISSSSSSICCIDISIYTNAQKRLALLERFVKKLNDISMSLCDLLTLIC